MEALLTEGLRNGSLGLSTGLEYDPGIHSVTEEVISLANICSDGWVINELKGLLQKLIQAGVIGKTEMPEQTDFFEVRMQWVD